MSVSQGTRGQDFVEAVPPTHTKYLVLYPGKCQVFSFKNDILYTVWYKQDDKVAHYVIVLASKPDDPRTLSGGRREGNSHNLFSDFPTCAMVCA